MKTPRNRISRLVAGQTLQKGVSKKLARELAAYLLTEGRTSELDSILRDVQADWAQNGYLEVQAASAHPFDAQLRSLIQKQLKQAYPAAKQINITEEYDPGVIGGVRLSLPNRQLDLSLATKLAKFKQAALSGKD